MLGSASYIHLGKWWLRAGRWVVLATALVGICMGYLYTGKLLVEQTNNTDKDILGADQKYNIKLAIQTREDLSLDFSKGVSQPIKKWFPHRFEGVVNPLWPWVAAWLVEDEHTISGDKEVSAQDRALFDRGRYFHIGWTCCALVILGVACARVFSIAASLNVVLLVGFGALLPRCAYFQPEPLFFVLFTITWLLCLFALHRNSLWLYGLVGVIGGLAYMAKGSVLPLLLVFIAVSMERWAWNWIAAQWPRRKLVTITTLWRGSNHWFALFMFGFCFLMTTGPMLSESAKMFGSPLHSFPSYWMWFDKYEDGYAWMNAHSTRAALEAIPKEERPSFSKYKATHTNEQMLSRLVQGTKVKVGELLAPKTTIRSVSNPKPWKGVLEYRGWYLGALAVILASLAVALWLGTEKPTNAAQALHPEWATSALLVFGATLGYTLAYGWYTPIGRGDRFMLSLYAPLVLCLVWASESLLCRVRRRPGSSRWISISYHIAQWLLVLAITWRLGEIVAFPYFKA
jgi:hypothetical protein